jgi:hypothetical protein
MVKRRRMTSAEVSALRSEIAEQMTSAPPPPPTGYKIDIDDDELAELQARTSKSLKKGG